MGFDAAYGPLAVRPSVCTSLTKPASPFDGQVIYMTDADQTAVWDGSSWVGLERSRDRNVIINGAMQVAQRGTSTASITAGGYYTADRFIFNVGTIGTWTQTVENDAPTGSGLIPCDISNTDYQAYLAWVAEGNTAEEWTEA